MGRVLDFRNLAVGCSVHRVQEWTAALPARFPNCNKVQLRIAIGNSYNAIGYRVNKLMPALSQ